MNKNKPIIAERIKNLRKEKGLTQEQLAEILGLNAKSSIANYESGANSPSDDIKKKMCDLFDCTMDYLMGKSDFKNFDKAFNDYIENQYQIDVNNALQSSLFDLTQCKLPIKQIESILLKYPYSSLSQEELKKIIEIQPIENKKKTQDIINNILDYINNCFEDRNLYHTFMYLKQKKNENETYYMCPVYRFYISRTT